MDGGTFPLYSYPDGSYTVSTFPISAPAVPIVPIIPDVGYWAVDYFPLNYWPPVYWAVTGDPDAYVEIWYGVSTVGESSSGSTSDNMVFVAQTALEVQLYTGIDLTTANTVKIKYIPPDKEQGEWVGTILEPASDGIISYTIQSTDDLYMDGKWKIWTHITFSGGKVAQGCRDILPVYKEGTACL